MTLPARIHRPPVGLIFLAGSALLHAGVLFGWPERPRATPTPSPRMTASLRVPPAPPAPPPTPAVSAPVPPPPAALHAPPTPPRPPVLARTTPPSAAAAPVVAPEPALPPAPAASPAPSAPPVSAVAAAAPPPPAPTPTARRPSHRWLLAYTQHLSDQVARGQQYPQIARVRGWQGTAVVNIQLSAAGAVLQTRLAQSSGHAVLDRMALDMVLRAEPLPPFPPDADGPVEVSLPIVFTLADARG